MLTTIAITAAGYCAALHLLKRVRYYMPPGKPRDALDGMLKVMGGGGSGPIKPQ